MPEAGRRWWRSFRARLLVLVLAVGFAPLAVVGFWLTGSAARGGELLLHDRMNHALQKTESRVGVRWLRARSWLLDLADAAEVRRALTGDQGDVKLPGPEPPAGVRHVLFESSSGVVIGSRAFDDQGGGGTVPIRVPVYGPEGDTAVGALLAELSADSLLGSTSDAAVPGILLSAFGAGTATALLSIPFENALLMRDVFEWGGERWMTRRVRLAEPPITLVAAAPTTLFARPFESAARRGTIILLLVAGVGAGIALLITRRLAHSLEQLAVATDGVAAGDFERRIDEGSRDEIGRVARAFNTMTENLRRTLHELSRREARAAAGEFAASLAHEVRNPLTAIRLDLQMVEEQLPVSSPLRDIQARALCEIERLDRSVGDALAEARDGGLGTREIDIRDPIRRAIHAVTPDCVARGVHLPSLDEAPAVVVRGEPGALTQLFLNLLRNAAQASPPGGTIRVRLEPRENTVSVVISDEGPGISSEALDRLFEPFFSTKPDGTGLGLSIARRIAEAHGGRVTLSSRQGAGATADTVLPLAR